MHTRAPRPVLIDTDTGIDDAVAVALAARLPALRVVGITTVHGNADTPRATRNAREVARRVGLSAPVVAGARAPLRRAARPARETHGEEGLGYVRPVAPPAAEADEAAEAIVALAAAHPRVVLCCLGPLTNVARALVREPELRSRIGPVFVMGGAVGVRGTMTPWSEFNWWADPEAADAVVRAGLDLRLVPLDVTRRIAVPGSAIRALESAAARDENARFWAEALRFYAQFHKAYESFDGCVVNDPLAVALAADDSLATWERMRIAVATSDDERRGAITRDETGGADALVATDVRAREVLGLIVRSVFGAWLADDAFDAGAHAAERWLEENRLEAGGRA